MNYKISTFLLLFLPFSGVFAQIAETEVKSKTEEVVVFRIGAQEYRSAKTPVNSGQSILKFIDLPNSINPNSIQIKGVENFTVLSVSYRLNYLNNAQTSPEATMISDSIELVANELNLLRKKIFVMEQEKKLFTDNKNMVGKDSGLDADELEEMLLLYGKRLTEIEGELMDRRREEAKFTERYSKLYAQYNTMVNKGNKSTGEILVTVNAKNKIASTDIMLSFYVTAAGWSPMYDIRAKDTKSDIEIDYMADVWQNTLYDWENVNLTLSSAYPNFTNTLPELSNWYLQYGYNNYGYYGKPDPDDRNTWYDSIDTRRMSVVNSDKTSTSIEFKIDKPYSIVSDGKMYKVDIGKHKVPATYSYFAVPKLEESAFILARLTGWFDLNLLAGTSKIYFGNSYVGEAYINPEIVEDTLDISLGNDEAIIIKRENISDYNAKSMTGNTRKKTETFEISVRNNRSHDIKIKILDQIPVSTDKEVVVTADEYSGAYYKKDNGELSWLLEVKAAETKKVRLQYTVKYPKNKIISNL